MHVKLGHSMDNGFIFKKINENQNVKERKKGWIGCADQLVDPKRPPGSFSLFYVLIFIYFFKYEAIVR